MPVVSSPAARFNGGAITGALEIDPTTDVTALKIKMPAGATQQPFRVTTSLDTEVLSVGAPGGSLAYAPNPAGNSSLFEFRNDGAVSFDNSAGDTYLSSVGGFLQLGVGGSTFVNLALDLLELANLSAAPADANIQNGSGLLWFNKNTSKLHYSAKVSGSVVTAELATLV